MRRAYFSYYETFEVIIAKFKTAEEREAFRKKLIAYGLYGTEPEDMTELEDMAWTLCRELIDQQQNRREINAQNARGERKKQLEAAAEPAPAQTQEPEPEQKPKRQPVKRAKFVKPTREEITAFCEEKGLKINVNKFYLHYESNGWRVGKNAMKSWKAAVQKWAETEKDFENHGKAAGTMWANNSADADTGNYEGIF